MKYFDRVYGQFEITEPVILELIKSAQLQRLKEIDQAGYRPLWVKPDAEVGEYDHSRFAHSVGVYLLLLNFGASLEEQTAGLIHDVSHSAFSHCIDYVLNVGSEKEHNHQDNVFEKFVEKTEIPQIIKRHGLRPEYIFDDQNFPLKERNLPDLCADRIDYSLRTAVIFGELNDKNRKYLLNNLIADGCNWVFRNFESAKRYADLFYLLNIKYYAGLPSAIMFRAVGDCLKYALQKRYISEGDLYTNDKAVIDKVLEFLGGDEKLNILYERMNRRVGVVNNPDDYDASVFCKSRIVDPLFRDGVAVKRVSDADSNWRIVIEREMAPKQYFLKFNQ